MHRIQQDFLDVLTFPYDDETRRNILSLYSQKETLLDVDLLQTHLENQPVLGAAILFLLCLSVVSLLSSILFISCRALGNCGAKRYQAHPTSGRLYSAHLVVFLTSWVLLTGSALFFVYSGVTFWNQRIPSQFNEQNDVITPLDLDRIHSIVKRGASPAPSVLDLFSNADYDGNFEQVDPTTTPSPKPPPSFVTASAAPEPIPIGIFKGPLSDDVTQSTETTTTTTTTITTSTPPVRSSPTTVHIEELEKVEGGSEKEENGTEEREERRDENDREDDVEVVEEDEEDAPAAVEHLPIRRIETQTISPKVLILSRPSVAIGPIPTNQIEIPARPRAEVEYRRLQDGESPSTSIRSPFVSDQWKTAGARARAIEGKVSRIATKVIPPAREIESDRQSEELPVVVHDSPRFRSNKEQLIVDYDETNNEDDVTEELEKAQPDATTTTAARQHVTQPTVVTSETTTEWTTVDAISEDDVIASRDEENAIGEAVATTTESETKAITSPSTSSTKTEEATDIIEQAIPIVEETTVSIEKATVTESTITIREVTSTTEDLTTSSQQESIEMVPAPMTVKTELDGEQTTLMTDQSTGSAQEAEDDQTTVLAETAVTTNALAKSNDEKSTEEEVETEVIEVTEQTTDSTPAITTTTSQTTTESEHTTAAEEETVPPSSTTTTELPTTSVESRTKPKLRLISIVNLPTTSTFEPASTISRIEESSTNTERLDSGDNQTTSTPFLEHASEFVPIKKQPDVSEVQWQSEQAKFPARSTTPTHVFPTASLDGEDFGKIEQLATPRMYPFHRLHTMGVSVLSKASLILLGSIMTLVTLPSLLLVVIGSGCYMRSYHPMDRTKTSEKTGQLVVVLATLLLLSIPLVLCFSQLSLLYVHTHHAACAPIQLQYQHQLGLLDAPSTLNQDSRQLIERNQVNTQNCRSDGIAIEGMCLSSLIFALSAIPLVISLFNLSKYYLRMKTEFYWTMEDNYGTIYAKRALHTDDVYGNIYGTIRTKRPTVRPPPVPNTVFPDGPIYADGPIYGAYAAYGRI